MKRYERIIDEICTGVQKEMESSILDGFDRLHVEYEYGTAWVDIEIYLAPSWLRTPDVQVMVMHEDEHHQSPTLEKAIIACLPDWHNIERTMQQVA